MGRFEVNRDQVFYFYEVRILNSFFTDFSLFILRATFLFTHLQLQVDLKALILVLYYALSINMHPVIQEMLP